MIVSLAEIQELQGQSGCGRVGLRDRVAGSTPAAARGHRAVQRGTLASATRRGGALGPRARDHDYRGQQTDEADPGAAGGDPRLRRRARRGRELPRGRERARGAPFGQERSIRVKQE